MEIQARKIPAGLMTTLLRYQEAISTVDYQHDYGYGWSYEVALKTGWCFDPGEHIAIASNARDMQRRLQDIEPCRCQQCKNEQRIIDLEMQMRTAL